MRSLLILLGFPRKWWVIFYCFQDFTALCLAFDILIMMCLFVDLLAFIFLGLYWDSWICRVLFYNKVWKFSANISLFFSVSFSLLYLWYSHYSYVGMLSGIHISLKFCFFSFFFLCFSLYDFYWSIFKFTNSSPQMYFWDLLVHFSSQLLHFSIVEFTFGSFLINNFYLVIVRILFLFNHVFLYFFEYVYNVYFEVFFLLNAKLWYSHKQFLLHVDFFSGAWVTLSYFLGCPRNVVGNWIF